MPLHWLEPDEAPPPGWSVLRVAKAPPGEFAARAAAPSLRALCAAALELWALDECQAVQVINPAGQVVLTFPPYIFDGQEWIAWDGRRWKDGIVELLLAGDLTVLKRR